MHGSRAELAGAGYRGGLVVVQHDRAGGPGLPGCAGNGGEHGGGKVGGRGLQPGGEGLKP